MDNTFIQTCKQAGISFRHYFKALLRAVKSGRTGLRESVADDNLLELTKILVKDF